MKIIEPANRIVVLASTADLEMGFARDLFIDWSDNPKNTIIFTTRTSSSTLASALIEQPNRRTVNVEIRERVKLEGTELDEHYQRVYEKEQLEAERLRKSKELESIDDESSSSDDDNDIVTVVPGKHDLMKLQEVGSRFVRANV
jgi:cleavage and polyadenylation specificity factor subunit 2